VQQQQQRREFVVANNRRNIVRFAGFDSAGAPGAGVSASGASTLVEIVASLFIGSSLVIGASCCLFVRGLRVGADVGDPALSDS
jgi:hypothetical protein